MVRGGLARRRTAFRSALRYRGECAQAGMMVIGNAYMTGQTVALSGGLSFL